MRTAGWLVVALVLAACGGSGGDGAQVVVQQPPGTVVCDTEINQETGAAVNVFCDSSGNVVGAGSVDSNNQANPTTNTDSNNNNNKNNVSS